MKKLLCLCVALLAVMSLVSCQNSAKDKDPETPKDTTAALAPDTAKDADTFVWAVEGYYKIYHGDTDENHLFFFYDLYGADSSVVKSECTYMAQPQIDIMPNDVIKVTVQSGTGRNNCFTYYYDRQNNRFSHTYDYVLCENSELIAYYATPATVVVRHMFDDKGYNKEIKLDISNAEEPVSKAAFADGGKSIEITYSTGSDLKQITEKFILN